METYFKAKLGLFTDGRAERAVVSLDSPYGARVAELANIPVVTISSHEAVAADYRVEAFG